MGTRVFVVGLLLATLTAAGLVAPAQASELDPTEKAGLAGVGAAPVSDETRAREFLRQYGVSAAIADDLIDLGRAGVLSDADTPGAVPVSVDRYRRDGIFYEVSRYRDGSVAVLESDVPREVQAGSAAPNSGIGGCTVAGSGSSYTTYTGCRVRYRTHLFSFGFYVNFTQNDAYATIGKVYGKFHDWAIGHEKQDWGLTVVTKRGKSSSPAHAYMWIEYLTGIGSVSATINKGIRFKAHGTRYWHETS